MKPEEHIEIDEFAAGRSAEAAAFERVREPATDFVACADASRRLFELARRVAASDCTVLISGESGSGKEVLARYIHTHSPRSGAPG